MKILIGADLVPTESNFENFKAGDATALVGKELKELLETVDYRIFNLETPLCNKAAPIEKCGPNLIAPTETVKGYQSLGVDLVTIANNHIIRQDAQGLFSTIDTLRTANIDYIGAGASLNEAKRPKIIESDGKKIGIYVCCEHEFSIATLNSPGANGFDPFESLDEITDLKKQCDNVIVLHHGGKEHYRYPSPRLQKVCTKMCDKGADLVICQHTHTVGCREEYNGSHIVYGQGNFLFDRSASEFWKTGILVSVDTTQGFKVEYIPLQKNGNAVKLAESNEILEAFEMRSEEIKQEGFVNSEYTKYSHSMCDWYLSVFRGWWDSRFFRFLNKITKNKAARLLLKKNSRYGLINYLECEAHNELILQALKNPPKKYSCLSSFYKQTE